MKKKEWIHYFETINGRKPSSHDIDEAIEKKEFQPNIVDIGLRFIREKIPNKKVRAITSLILLFVIMGVLFFPFFRLTYYNVMSGVFDEKYQSVVEEYQKSIDNEDDGKEYKKILEQPSRVPSYSQIDSNNDGKKELYIAFNDGENQFEILAIYEVQFGKVKKVDVSDRDISEELLSEANWKPFDVQHLMTMNLEELSENNFSSVEGLWRTKDGTQKISFDDEGLATVNGFDARQEKSVTLSKYLIYDWDTTLSGRFLFREISKGSMYGTLERRDGSDSLNGFNFIPKGIEADDSDVKLDRIYDEIHKRVYYRSSEVNNQTSVSRKNGMNIDELARGNYSSIAGTWGLPNNQGLATRVRIDNDGTMYWDNSTTAGKTIHDVIKNSDNSGLGVMGAEYDRQSAPTGSYVNFFPAGVVVKGGEDSDSSKDRIAFGGTVTNYNDPYVFYRLDE